MKNESNKLIAIAIGVRKTCTYHLWFLGMDFQAHNAFRNADMNNKMKKLASVHFMKEKSTSLQENSPQQRLYNCTCHQHTCHLNCTRCHLYIHCMSFLLMHHYWLCQPICSIGQIPPINHCPRIKGWVQCWLLNIMNQQVIIPNSQSFRIRRTE